MSHCNCCSIAFAFVWFECFVSVWCYMLKFAIHRIFVLICSYILFMFNISVLYAKVCILIWICILIIFPDKGVHGEVGIMAPKLGGVGIFCKIKSGHVYLMWGESGSGYFGCNKIGNGSAYIKQIENMTISPKTWELEFGHPYAPPKNKCIIHWIHYLNPVYFIEIYSEDTMYITLCLIIL